MNRKNIMRWTLPVLVLVIAFGIVYLLVAAKPEVVEKKAEFPPLVVRVANVESAQTKWSSRFQGEVRAQTNIELVSEVTGKIVSVSRDFTEGGSFEAGEALAEIDGADYQVALQSAVAAVAEAQVALDIEMATAETRLREWKMLNKNNQQIANAKPLQLNRPQVQQAQARLDAAQAQLDAAKLNVDRTKIKAPFAGRVLSKKVGLGQFVSRGMGLGNVFASDVVEIRIPMTDTQLSELQLTMGFRASSFADSPEVKVFVDFAGQQQQWQGYLKAVDASIDNETRLVYATVVVNDPYVLGGDHQVPLAPGLFVEVEISSPQSIAGIGIPRDALRNGNRVYVFEDDKLFFRDVNVLVTSNQNVVVNSGLSAGDQVIISPVPSAYNGMAVEVKTLSEKGKDKEIAEAVTDEATEKTTEEVAEGEAETKQETGAL